MTKYNEIQMDKKQNDTEVIHREVTGGTKTKWYLWENQSEFSEKRRRKDLVKKTLRIRYKKESRVTHCDNEFSSKDVVRRRSSRQSESTNRSSTCVCH